MGYVRLARLGAALFGLLAAVSQVAWTQNACDLDNNGVVNIVDAQLATNMYLGVTACPSTIAINGPGVCNQVVIDRVKAAIGGTCVVDHYVSLNWTASTTPNVTYNIYRRTGTSGQFTIVGSTSLNATSHVDVGMQGGQTYQYVARAVSGGQESADSNIATVPVPSP